MSDGPHDLEQWIRRRAYELWEAAGRPEGHGDEFWLDACAEMTSFEENAVPTDPSRPPARHYPTDEALPRLQQAGTESG